MWIGLKINRLDKKIIIYLIALIKYNLNYKKLKFNKI